MIQEKVKTFPNILSIGAVVVFLSFQPGLLATFSASGHLVLSVLIISILMIGFFNNNVSSGIAWFYPYYFLITGYFLILLIGHVFVEPATFSRTLSMFIVSQVGLLFVFILINSLGVRKILFSIVFIMFFLGLSYLIFWVFLIFFDHSRLLLKQFEMPGYDGIQSLYFPFSIFYQQEYQLFGINIPRAIGIFREPGVYQAFAASSIGMLDVLEFSFRKKMLFSIVISIGFLSTLSTAAIVTMATLIFYYVYRIAEGRKVKYKALAIIVGTVGILFVVFLGNLENVGLVSKFEGQSGQVRYSSIVRAWESGLENPVFGVGLNTDKRLVQLDWGVPNLVASVGATGWISFILYLVFVAVTVRKNHNKKSLPILLPFLVTMLTSQPLFYSMSVIGIFLLPVNKVQSV